MKLVLKKIRKKVEMYPYAPIYKIAFEYFERIFRYKILKRHFLKRTGYNLNLKNPKTLNEKLNWIKIYDKRSIYSQLSDKYQVRNYIIETLGEDIASKYLVPLIFVTDDPFKISFSDLQSGFVVKATNGSGTNIIVNEGECVDENMIIEQCQYWLKSSYGISKHEWHYSKIKNQILIEKLIKDKDGLIPRDYKLFVFNGRCQFIQVIMGRFQKTTQVIYDRNWKEMDLVYIYPKGISEKAPKGLEEMIELAEKLSIDLPFVRVDLYNLEGKIYFGEMTFFPMSGFEPFYPKSYDLEFGQLCKLPS